MFGLDMFSCIFKHQQGQQLAYLEEMTDCCS
jgi:hypothetical protein